MFYLGICWHAIHIKVGIFLRATQVFFFGTEADFNGTSLVYQLLMGHLAVSELMYQAKLPNKAVLANVEVTSPVWKTAGLECEQSVFSPVESVLVYT